MGAAPKKADERAAELFELAPDEIEICLNMKTGAARYELRHRLRPPALEDWREYERVLRSTVEMSDAEPEALVFGSSPLEAAAAIYDRLCRGASGYQDSDGTWGAVGAERVPLHHKEMVIRALSDVAPEECRAPAGASQDGSEADAPCALFALDGEHVEIALEASRAGRAYRLVHVFRPPSAADRVAFSRVMAQALYVRDSRTLRTILPPRLPGLAALYDRLIERVEGYAIHGAPPGEAAAIIRHMDPLHKKVAVQALFAQ